MSTSAELTVTIKYGKGYEESWAVFRGTSAEEIRTAIATYFGLPEDAIAGMTGHEVVLQATGIAHGHATVASILGGIPVPDAGGSKGEGGDPWEAFNSKDAYAVPKGEATEEDPFADLIKRLGEAGSTDELHRLWATNQDSFSNEAVMEAYKARGKQLTAA